MTLLSRDGYEEWAPPIVASMQRDMSVTQTLLRNMIDPEKFLENNSTVFSCPKWMELHDIGCERRRSQKRAGLLQMLDRLCDAKKVPRCRGIFEVVKDFAATAFVKVGQDHSMNMSSWREAYFMAEQRYGAPALHSVKKIRSFWTSHPRQSCICERSLKAVADHCKWERASDLLSRILYISETSTRALGRCALSCLDCDGEWPWL